MKFDDLTPGSLFQLNNIIGIKTKCDKEVWLCWVNGNVHTDAGKVRRGTSLTNYTPVDATTLLPYLEKRNNEVQKELKNENIQVGQWFVAHKGDDFEDVYIKISDSCYLPFLDGLQGRSYVGVLQNDNIDNSSCFVPNYRAIAKVIRKKLLIKPEPTVTKPEEKKPLKLSDIKVGSIFKFGEAVCLKTEKDPIILCCQGGNRHDYQGETFNPTTIDHVASDYTALLPYLEANKETLHKQVEWSNLKVGDWFAYYSDIAIKIGNQEYAYIMRMNNEKWTYAGHTGNHPPKEWMVPNYNAIAKWIRKDILKESEKSGVEPVVAAQEKAEETGGTPTDKALLEVARLTEELKQAKAKIESNKVDYEKLETTAINLSNKVVSSAEQLKKEQKEKIEALEASLNLHVQLNAAKDDIKIHQKALEELSKKNIELNNLVAESKKVDNGPKSPVRYGELSHDCGAGGLPEYGSWNSWNGWNDRRVGTWGECIPHGHTWTAKPSVAHGSIKPIEYLQTVKALAELSSEEFHRGVERLERLEQIDKRGWLARKLAALKNLRGILS